MSGPDGRAFDHEPTIIYTPDLDGDPDPGEVVWTWVPYEEDPNQGKDRPVLVIGWDGDQMAAVALSSKDHTDHPENVLLGEGGWDREHRPSYVKLDRILRVDPKEVRREGAILDRNRFDQVVARLRELHGWAPS
jgi:hypothetical protein